MNLQKLTIRGIRSFGPSDADVQGLTFFSPVTLIVGPNGTGKTTVIECIRYSSTGEMPAGSKQGASFVYDLKLANENEVRGQVRLSFTDTSGKLVKVQRSLCAALPVSGKQVTLRTLENAISRIDDHGNVCQISSKCADVDREIVQSLGVSKAILENVIFCHQEDCNWPLGEGKIVKSKFDDIFATTKYVKALEEIRKIRQDKNQQFKLNSVELVHLRRNRDRANEIGKQILELESVIAKDRENFDVLNRTLPQTNAELEEISRKVEYYHKMHNQLASLKNQNTTLENQISDLTAIIRGTSLAEYAVAGVDEDTVKTLRMNHQEKIAKNQVETRSQEAEDVRLTRALNNCCAELDRQNHQLLTLRCQSESIAKIEKHINECKLVFDSMAANLIGDHTASSTTDYQAIIDKCKIIAEHRNSERKQTEAGVCAKFEKIYEKRCSYEQKKMILVENRADLIKQLQHVEASIQESECSAKLINEVDKEIEMGQNEQANFSEENLQDMKTKIVMLATERDKLNREMQKCDEEMTMAMKFQDVRTELDIGQKHINQKSRQLENLMDMKSSDIERFLSVSEPDKMNPALKERLSQLISLINQQQPDEQRLSNEVAKCKSRLEMQKLTKKQKEAMLNSLRARLSKSGIALDPNNAAYEHIDKQHLSDSGQERYEHVYERRSNELKVKQDEKGFMSGVEKTYNKFLKKVAASNECPLCHREFKDQSEVEDLIDEMKQTIETVPASQKRIDEEITKLSADFKEMISLKPLLEQLNETGRALTTVKLELGVGYLALILFRMVFNQCGGRNR